MADCCARLIGSVEIAAHSIIRFLLEMVSPKRRMLMNGVHRDETHLRSNVV